MLRKKKVNDYQDSLEPIEGEVILLRMVFAGDASVGKTSILCRRTDGKFETNYTMTIGIDFKLLEQIFNGSKYKIQCWDTSGQERFHSITHGYFKTAHGVLLVFDVHNRESFVNLDRWMKIITEGIKSDVPIILVGNKSDLRADEILQKDDFILLAEIKEWIGAQSTNMQYIEVSAKNDDRIMELFLLTLESMVLYRNKQLVKEAKEHESIFTIRLPANHDGSGNTSRRSKCCGFY